MPFERCLEIRACFGTERDVAHCLLGESLQDLDPYRIVIVVTHVDVVPHPEVLWSEGRLYNRRREVATLRPPRHQPG